MNKKITFNQLKRILRESRVRECGDKPMKECGPECECEPKECTGKKGMTKLLEAEDEEPVVDTEAAKAAIKDLAKAFGLEVAEPEAPADDDDDEGEDDDEVVEVDESTLRRLRQRARARRMRSRR